MCIRIFGIYDAVISGVPSSLCRTYNEVQKYRQLSPDGRKLSVKIIRPRNFYCHFYNHEYEVYDILLRLQELLKPYRPLQKICIFT